jgi:hypothetical protein
MRLRRSAAWLLAPTLLLAAPSWAQAGASGEEEKAWSLGASLSWYFVRDQKNFGVPTATADHGPVHLETRYNYEALKTASAFVGWNLEFGETVKLGLTPILGCMFGEAGGPILGLELALGWGRSPSARRASGSRTSGRHGRVRLRGPSSTSGPGSGSGRASSSSARGCSTLPARWCSARCSG